MSRNQSDLGAVLRTGSGYDTSSPAGCCGATSVAQEQRVEDQRVDAKARSGSSASVAPEQRVAESGDPATRVSRDRSVTGKVTEEEYQRLLASARPEKISAWARSVLLRAAGPDPLARAVLAELIALRTVLVNLHFALANGHGVSVEQMQSLIERADADKWSRADERVAALAPGAKK